MCSIGWPYLASMGGEAVGPVKARCPSVGNVRVVRWEWVTVWRSTLIEGMGRGER